MEKLSMRDVQLASLEILKKVDQVCEKLNLKYFLAYGTLIGAIRHKGFIPWDDDIDIMMPRADYDVLVEYFISHHEELKPFEVINPKVNAKCPYTISRISDSRYSLDVDNEEPYGIGVFIDIYPLDGAGKTVSEYTKLKNKTSRLASLCFLSSKKAVKRENTKSIMKYIIKYPAFIFAKLLGRDFFIQKLYQIASECKYDKSDYVGCIIWASDDGLRGIFKKEWFNEVIETEFEGCKFKIPKDYDKILTHCYGNYMQLPQEKDRIAHHYYDAYKK